MVFHSLYLNPSESSLPRNPKYRTITSIDFWPGHWTNCMRNCERRLDNFVEQCFAFQLYSFISLCVYSLISIRLIYYFDTFSHCLIWHCSNMYEDLHRFARNLQHMSVKLFLLLFLNNFRQTTPKNNNNFALICCKFLANLCKSS